MFNPEPDERLDWKLVCEEDLPEDTSGRTTYLVDKTREVAELEAQVMAYRWRCVVHVFACVMPTHYVCTFDASGTEGPSF